MTKITANTVQELYETDNYGSFELVMAWCIQNGMQPDHSLTGLEDVIYFLEGLKENQKKS